VDTPENTVPVVFRPEQAPESGFQRFHHITTTSDGFFFSLRDKRQVLPNRQTAFEPAMPAIPLQRLLHAVLYGHRDGFSAQNMTCNGKIDSAGRLCQRMPVG